MANTKFNHSLCVAETELGKAIMAFDRSHKGPEECHLYMVTLTRERRDRYPSVSNHFVIAPDGDEAIQQCENLAFPEVDWQLTDEHRKCLTASAVQVPVMLRGWGVQTF